MTECVFALMLPDENEQKVSYVSGLRYIYRVYIQGVYIQGVPGGMCQTSGECSLG